MTKRNNQLRLPMTWNSIRAVAGAFVLATSIGVSPAHAQRQWSSDLYLDAFTGSIECSVEFDADGNGPNPPVLLVGGHINSLPDGQEAWGIAKWDGQTWSALPPLFLTRNKGHVMSMAVFDEDGPGGPALPSLFVGGEFNSQIRLQNPDLSVVGIAKLNAAGTAWLPVGPVVQPFSDITFAANLNGTVATVMHTHDDGSGPALYVGGNWRVVNGQLCNGLAKWNGTSWSAPSPIGVLGSDADNTYPKAMITHDPDGPGGVAPQLYIAGNFNEFNHPLITQWDGTNLLTVGSFQTFTIYSINALESFGGNLYAAVDQINEPGLEHSTLRKFDGVDWSEPLPIVDPISSLVAANDGTGDALYIGMVPGHQGPDVACVRRWDGASVQFIGADIAAVGKTGATLIGFNDGTGTKVHTIEGLFHQRWNGNSWDRLNTNGQGTFGKMAGITFADLDGAGPQPGKLYSAAFANFGTTYPSDFNENLSYVKNFWVGAFDGTEWSILGEAFTSNTSAESHYPSGTSDTPVLCHVPSGPAEGLYVCGLFSAMGYPTMVGDPKIVNSISRWNGASWAKVGSGGVLAEVPVGNPPNISTQDGAINDAITFDPDGSGPLPPRLVVAGFFSNAGGVAANNIAMWDGSSWSTLGTGVDGVVQKLAIVDFGSGPRLFAAGKFQNAGGSPALRIAQWDGTSWSPLGSGLDTIYPAGMGYEQIYANLNISISAMAQVVDTSGTGLVVAGNFIHAGGIVVHHVARWNGSSWTPMYNGLPLFHLVAVPPSTPGTSYNTYPFTGDYTSDFTFTDFETWDDGTGPALYATNYPSPLSITGYVNGNIYTPDLWRIVPLPRRVAKWTGTSWVPLSTGTGFDSMPGTSSLNMHALAKTGDGPSSSLYVTGDFRIVDADYETVLADPVTPVITPFGLFNGVRTNGIARWEPGIPDCVADVDDGSGTGTPDGGVTIDDLLFYLSIFGQGDVRADIDNGTGTGTTDGGVTIDDLLYYLARFGQGC